jgi:hypothetical protein
MTERDTDRNGALEASKARSERSMQVIAPEREHNFHITTSTRFPNPNADTDPSTTATTNINRSLPT